MPSSNLTIDKRRRTFVRLIGEVQHALNQAFVEESEARGLTRVDMAKAIEKDKSFITRKLNDPSNMTFETLADLAYALDRPVKITLPSRHASAHSNNATSEPQSYTRASVPMGSDIDTVKGALFTTTAA